MRLISSTFAFFAFAFFVASSAVRAEFPEANATTDEVAENFFPELARILAELPSKAPLLAEENLRVEEARADRLVADSQRGLRISLGANAQSLNEDRPGAGYYHRQRFFASATILRPLYHWGALRAGSRIAELSEQSIRAARDELSLTLAERIRGDYLALILAAYETELARDSLTGAQAAAEGMQERLRLGLVTELALAETKTNVLQQSIRLAELERNLLRSRLIFQEDTGGTETLDLNVTAAFRRFAETHAFATRLPLVIASPASVSLDNLERSIESENQRLVVARSSLRPKLNFIGAFYQDQVDLVDSRSSFERNNLLVGLELDWALFDARESKGRTRSAHARKLRYEMQLERETRRLRLELESSREHLLTLAKIIQSRRQLVAAAVDRLEKSQTEFDRARITPDQFFAARLAQDQANLALLRSVADYLAARARYESHLRPKKGG